jgi:hypothetical protein
LLNYIQFDNKKHVCIAYNLNLRKNVPFFILISQIKLNGDIFFFICKACK